VNLWRWIVGLVTFVTILASQPGSAFASSSMYGYDAVAQHLTTVIPNHAATATRARTPDQPPGGRPAESVYLAFDFVAAETGTNAGAKSVDEVLGSPPKGNQGIVRPVPDESTLQPTFNEPTRGATKTERKGCGGSVYALRDGTQIGLRGSSTSSGATIDIRGADGSTYKIHIG